MNKFRKKDVYADIFFFSFFLMFQRQETYKMDDHCIHFPIKTRLLINCYFERISTHASQYENKKEKYSPYTYYEIKYK